MTMSLCCRPATPSLSMPATLMVCEINRQREREGEVGRSQGEGHTKCLGVVERSLGYYWLLIGDYVFN